MYMRSEPCSEALSTSRFDCLQFECESSYLLDERDGIGRTIGTRGGSNRIYYKCPAESATMYGLTYVLTVWTSMGLAHTCPVRRYSGNKLLPFASSYTMDLKLNHLSSDLSSTFA